MNICIFAGETSADLYSAMLLVELRKKLPTARFWGVGGPSSKGLINVVIPMEKFQVMGLSDVLKALPRLARCFFQLAGMIMKKNPDMVIIIDQPSFGIKLAKQLRKKGYRGKIVQFVAPTVWAWKKERADEMAKHFDLLLTLFDFEPDYFAHTSLKTVFVGHPIVELIAKDNSQSLVLDPDRPVLAIFPGSRPAEIGRNLPKQLEAAKIYCESHPTTQIAVVASCDLPQHVIKVPFNARYELMKKCHLAIAKSGTVTLELALHKVPTVVTYELSWLNYLMARYVMKVDKMAFFSIVNILAGYELFFERIKPPVTCQDIANCLEEYESSRYNECQEGCQSLKTRLDHAAIQHAAKEICELF
ncbi:MAG: lipid-A-disaccharide synthase [Verrucomicrobia bacterium]|nr:lipid-A-disaccharide synthase [Verrucomicrobiota bacterium]MBS0636657.1 lipid-A-disaccharide synthase [Verrucomicrobiota bacterium]